MAIAPGRGIVAALIAAAPLLAQTVPVTEHTLANGMRLLLVERHDQPTVASGWITRAGSANERPGITGIAHLFEHMMFKGSKAIGTKDIKRDLELNDLQDQLKAEIRKEDDLLRARQLRGEIPDMTDPKARSAHHQELIVAFGKLVKEQQELLVKGEFDTIFTKAGATATNAFTTNDETFFYVQVPSNKLEIGADGTTNILLMRTGEKKKGVVGLFQPGLAGEVSPSLSVRWMGINQQGASKYLISLYCSAAILTEDALGVLENVQVRNYHEYRDTK